MYQSIISGAYHGMESYLVHVEVDVSDGLPCMEMIGYLAGEVKESRERVRVGIKNSGYKIPPKRVTISLSPADIRKSGSGFDLAVALGIIFAVMGEKGESRVMKDLLKATIVLGELGLDGSVKPIKGVLPILLKAAEEGMRYCMIPEENRKEAELVKGMCPIPVTCLKDAVAWVESICRGKEMQGSDGSFLCQKNKYDSSESVIMEEWYGYKEDFSQIVGQQLAKRAAEIAAAGLHNLLLFGPPGSGKSMIAQRICTLLPPMTYEECLEVTKIRSVTGELNAKETLVMKRPYEAVHHLVTPQGLIGGGTLPAPGMVTRAHKGVLFLDELPEFGRAKLDMLRQPMEDRKVRIVRKQYACEYPADFMLVAAMNPCPCGYYPDRNKCNCRPSEIAAYLKRISGPLLDRVDISVEVGKTEWEHLHSKKEQESSADIRCRVKRAYEFQMERQQKLNSELTREEMERVCEMRGEAKQLLQYTFREREKSIRSYDRMRKVARTIADLDASEKIEEKHMAEAIVLNGGMETLMQKGMQWE